MNLDDYEKKYEAAYAEFAGIVKLVLEKAIAGTAGVPRPQSIQCRAKSASHLRPKLENRGLLDSQAIEQEIRDLAGARLIFYTNTDVDRFLQSRLIPDNFEVHWDATRVHHPIEENARQRYQAIHYTVSLNQRRTALPEYATFIGMRCEIQLQTILSHAWAETAHDMLYKPPTIAGFGSNAMQSIQKRMTRIMDDYLVPAGYEFQKVQSDFERLMQGKALFDRGALDALAACGNNNERHEILSTIKEYVLPNYDDIGGIYAELRRALLKSFDDSRETPTLAIETPFGNLPGETPEKVAAIIIDIFANTRYVDVDGSFGALLHIYKGERSTTQRSHVSRVAKELAEYNLHVWRQAGPAIQMVLTNSIDRLSPEQRLEFRNILITVWGEVLSTELKGTSFSADAVTFRSGALGVHDEIKQIRRSAIDGLFDILDRGISESDKTAAVNALWAATRLPSQATYTNDLCSLVLADTQRIVEMLTVRITGLPYQLLGHIENHLLFEYARARDIATAEQDTFESRDQADSLMRAVRSFRDAANANILFVRYKTLVGYDSVFQSQWEGDRFDFQQQENYRKEQIAEYVNVIGPENEDEWFDLIELCAATKSSDLATFPLFGEFIFTLAKQKPKVAAKLLESASTDLLAFLPAFLGGLYRSGAQEIYERYLARHLDKGTNLAAIVLHWRNSRPDYPPFIQAVLDKAIAGDDEFAIMECVVATIAVHGSPNQPPLDGFFGSAMRYLAARKNYRWIHRAWFLPQAPSFFAELSAELSQTVLESLLGCPKLDHEAEKILCCVAKPHADLVWGFFGNRLADKERSDQDPSYDAIPYEFHGLEKKLSTNMEQAVEIVRSWYHPQNPLFEFGGAQLLHAVFPSCPPPFACRLSRMVEEGSDDDIDFTITVLHRYKGEPATHGVLKAIISRLADDDPRLAKVQICLENTGVVSGQFGFVEAYRSKKAEIESWHNHEHAKVRAFAEKFVIQLDRRIALEQRSAEERSELRKREYDADDTES